MLLKYKYNLNKTMVYYKRSIQLKNKQTSFIALKNLTLTRIKN